MVGRERWLRWSWVAVVALVAACSGEGGSSSPPTTAPPSPAARGSIGTVTVRLGAPFTSYNNGTASDNATANQEVVNATDQSITWNLASWSLQ